ncbi:MAG: MoaD/ThiS family protein [Promethearchaeota archaeon]|jgi:MoaD family protein
MNVEVLYFAEFKEITGKEKEDVELVSKSLKELIDILLSKYIIQNLLWDEKIQNIHNNISLIINNKPIHDKDPLLIELKEGDSIAFLTPVSGG